MKTLTTLLLLMLFSGLSYAQTTKPTIEETVQYIKMMLEEIDIYTSHYTDNSDRYPWINRYKNYTNLNMASCILKMTEENVKVGMGAGDDETTSVKVEKFIDFSKVESITFSYYEESERADGAEYYYLSFNSKTENNKMENIKIAIGLVGKGTDISSFKIYKAFQHLRKLCGAPEPISFD